VALVVIERSAWDPGASAGPGGQVGGRGWGPGPAAFGEGVVVRVAAGRPFDTAWNATIGRPVCNQRIGDLDTSYVETGGVRRRGGRGDRVPR